MFTPEVNIIRQTIKLDRIRTQTIQWQPATVRWGIVTLDGLPFCFTAWRQRKKLGYLPNGLPLETQWGFVLVPEDPLKFCVPLFTEDITENDIGPATKDRDSAYSKFYDHYFNDPEYRRAYCTAVSMACDTYDMLRV